MEFLDSNIISIIITLVLGVLGMFGGLKILKLVVVLVDEVLDVFRVFDNIAKIVRVSLKNNKPTPTDIEKFLEEWDKIEKEMDEAKSAWSKLIKAIKGLKKK